MNRHLTSVLLIGFLQGLILPVVARSQDFRKSLAPFFARHCNDCHAAGEAEGGLNLDKLSANLNEAAAFTKWERIYDRVKAAEMPPQDASQPRLQVSPGVPRSDAQTANARPPVSERDRAQAA